MFILEIKGIKKTYYQGEESIVVLEDLYLNLSMGESVAIVGKSGSGKSTLLNIIAGLDKFDSGQIVWKGKIRREDPASLTLWRRRNVGIVFQFYHLLPELSVVENVALPLLLIGMDRKSAYKKALLLLRDFGMGAFADREIRYLSGGEMQRVAILRAVVHRPSLILADEPTGSLDPYLQERVLDFLLRACSVGGAGLVLATHSKEIAMRMDRVVELRDGKLRPIMLK